MSPLVRARVNAPEVRRSVARKAWTLTAVVASTMRILVCLLACAAIAPVGAHGQTFSYTGSEQSYLIPAGVAEVHIVAAGAPGKGPAAGPITAGLGAVVSADVPIPMGQVVLYVEVGGSGTGFNGGGAPNGGDASDVRLVARDAAGSVDSRILVAAGGGGNGSDPGGNAGADGGGGAAGGKAGTATAGGLGGGPCAGCGPVGASGSLGQGGAAAAGGGGGGGYYGGGAGVAHNCGGYCDMFGGGGGGSSYASPQTVNTIFGLDQTQTPQVTITPLSAPAPSPSLTMLSVSPASFSIAGRRIGKKCRPLTKSNRADPRCRTPIKLTISYQLNVSAAVTFTLELAHPGVHENGQCKPATNASRRRTRCTYFVPLTGSIALQGNTGANSFTFTGRLGGRQVTPGTYQLIATPSDATGPQTPQTASFRIFP